MAEEFHIGLGGPLYRVERATRLDSLRRLIVAAVAITWVPLIVLSLFERLIHHPSELILQDLSVHVRLLVSLPLLLLAEELLEWSCRVSVRRLFDDGFVPPEKYARARAVLRSAEFWRDSPLPEAILVVAAVGVGVASLTGIVPPAGIVHGVVESRYSPVRVWYALISLPLSQFVLWRSLFRWALWARVLGGISRLPLRLLPTHADRRGGIDFLKEPSMSYGTVLLLAVNSALCGGWGTQIILYGTKIQTFKPLLVAFALVGAIIAFAPLLSFVRPLLVMRFRGRHQFGGLAVDYSRQLQERWLDKPEREGLLGSSDFQSLADLNTTYRETVERVQIFLFGPRELIVVFVISQIPTLPILLSQLPAREVLQRLLRLVTGGMPG